MDEQQTPDEPAVPRVIDRLRSAGLSDERIQMHLARRAVRVDGEPVADLEQPAPPPAHPVIGPT